MLLYYIFSVPSCFNVLSLMYIIWYSSMGAMGVVKKDVVSIRDCVTVQQVDEECEQCGYNCVESVKKLSEEAGWEHDEVGAEDAV